MSMLRYDTEVITQEYGDIAVGDLVDKTVHVFSENEWKQASFNSPLKAAFVIVSLTPIVPNGHDWIVPDIEDAEVYCTTDQRWVSNENKIIQNVRSGDIILASAPDKNFDMCWIVNFVNDTQESDKMIGATIGAMALASGVCVYM